MSLRSHYSALKTLILPPVNTTEDPKDWPRRKKNLVLFTIAYCAFVGALASSIYMPAVLQVKEDLNTTSELVSATLSVYVLFLGCMPIFWASLCDHFGRRPIYLVSTVIFILGSLFAAISHNIWIFFVMRAFQAFGSSSAIAIGGGALSDIFHSTERGLAFGLFNVGPLIAPMLGPIVGGALAEHAGWRSTMWLLLATAVVALLLVIFAFPETYRRQAIVEPMAPTAGGAIQLQKMADSHSEPTLVSGQTSIVGEATTPTVTPTSVSYKRKTFNPLRPLLCLRRSTTSLLVAFNGLALGAQFCLNNTLPLSFHYVYKLSETTIGLCFCSAGLGSVVGSLLGGRYSDYVVKRWLLKQEMVRLRDLRDRQAAFGGGQEGKGEDGPSHNDKTEEVVVKVDMTLRAPPEVRLRSVWLGVFLLPFGLLMYGWCVQAETFLVWPLVGMFLLGFGMMIVTASVTTALVDANSENNMASSAVACNSFAKGVIGAISGFASLPMFDAMGNGWLYTFWAAMTILGAAGLGVLVVRASMARKRQQQQEAQRIA